MDDVLARFRRELSGSCVNFVAEIGRSQFNLDKLN